MNPQAPHDINVNFSQLLFIAEQCTLQETEPMSVFCMAQAWKYAEAMKSITPDTVLEIGKLIEPVKNFRGFRERPVHIAVEKYGKQGQKVIGINHQLIPPTVATVCFHVGRYSPGEFYAELMRVHPFVDGNGRAGAVLFNFLNGSLQDPIHPPHFSRDV